MAANARIGLGPSRIELTEEARTGRKKGIVIPTTGIMNQHRITPDFSRNPIKIFKLKKHKVWKGKSGKRAPYMWCPKCTNTFHNTECRKGILLAR